MAVPVLTRVRTYYSSTRPVLEGSRLNGQRASALWPYLLHVVEASRPVSNRAKVRKTTQRGTQLTETKRRHIAKLNGASGHGLGPQDLLIPPQQASQIYQTLVGNVTNKCVCVVRDLLAATAASAAAAAAAAVSTRVRTAPLRCSNRNSPSSLAVCRSEHPNQCGQTTRSSAGGAAGYGDGQTS